MTTRADDARSHDGAEREGGEATLPPPDFVGRAARRVTEPPPALKRRTGKVASEAKAILRMAQAQAKGDADGERSAALALAALLEAQDRELGRVAALLGCALSLGGDDALRDRLARVEEKLGRLDRAADALVGSRAGGRRSTLVRVGTLRLRAGDAASAKVALSEALGIETDAGTAELLASVGFWSEEIGERIAAARQYLEAAELAKRAGSRDGELEDLARAHELAVDRPEVVRRLFLALEERGNDRAADELLRRHAARVDPAHARSVHAERRQSRLARGDVGGEFVAAIEEGLGAELAGEGADSFDDLLLRGGLLEALAARLALRAAAAKGEEKVRLLLERVQLYAGPLSDPVLAALASADVLTADPENREALWRLGVQSRAGKIDDAVLAVLVEALRGDTDARSLSLAKLVAEVAETRGDAPLFAFALRRIIALEPRSRFASSLAAAEERAAKALAPPARGAGEASETDSSELSEWAKVLRWSPDHRERVLALLRTLGEAGVDAALTIDVVRRTLVAGDIFLTHRGVCSTDAERWSRVLVKRARSSQERIAARLLLARALILRGAFEQAFDELVPLMDERELDRHAAGWLFALGTMVPKRAGVGRMGEHIAVGLKSSMAASLGAWAARCHLAAGAIVDARRAAGDACDRDPVDARAIAVHADAWRAGSVDATLESVVFAALERASRALWPDGGWLADLARLAGKLGDGVAALAAGQRLATLRPGDPEVLLVLVDAVVDAGDPALVGEAAAWVLSLVQPLDHLAPPVLRALEALRLEPERALGLARQAFQVMGPHPLLTQALLEAGREADDSAFIAVVLERSLSVGEARGEAGNGQLELASLLAKAGDREGQARALRSAVREGADVVPLATQISTLAAQPLSPDGELLLLELQAELAQALGGGEEAFALRDLGAALWDMVDDRAAAVAAWVEAARRTTFRPYTTLRLDLVIFAGAEDTLGCLIALAEQESEPARAGAIAAEGARVALALGDTKGAFDLAKRALELNPTHTGALATAEAGVTDDSLVPSMSELYELVAKRALGRFGRRAAHYRGARFLESRAADSLAMRHAAQAFLAVPSEGSTFQVLARTAARSGDRATAVQAVEQVADGYARPALRAGWLIRAASLADDDADGLAQRIDVLVRALVLAPEPATLELLGDAFVRLLALSPEEGEALVLRLERAARSVLKKVDGPDGARVALGLAELACDVGRDPALAWACIEQALACDGGIDEFRRIVRLVPGLVVDAEARPAFERALAQAEKPYSSVGVPALVFLVAVASALSEPLRRRDLLLLGVEREDDDELVLLAHEALREFPDPALAARFAKRVSEERLAEVQARGARQPSEPPLPESAESAESAGASPPDHDWDASVDTPVRRHVEAEALAPDLRATVPNLQLEPLLKQAADTPTEEGEQIAALKRLARLRMQAGEDLTAEAAWNRVLELAPDDEDADYALETIYVTRGAHASIAEQLARRALRLAGDPSRRESLKAVRLRRAALLEQRLGRSDEACAELERLLHEVPESDSGLRYLADLYERAGELDRVIELLQRLAALHTTDLEIRDDVEIRIARAHQASGRFEAARAAAMQVLTRSPESVEAHQLRVDLARVGGDVGELGDALFDLAHVSPDDAHARSALLVEAAQAAARAGDVDASLRRAQEAARVAPTVASAQLFARGLEYRLRGAGTRVEARETVEALSGIRGPLAPDDVALRAFLTAEALSVVDQPAPGLALLLECRARIGPHSLLALGIAERLAAEGRHGEALEAFIEARSGHLLGLRRPSEVSLAASSAASQAGDFAKALRFAEEAASDPDARIRALEQQRDVAQMAGDVARYRAALRQLEGAQSGIARIEPLKALAMSLLGSQVASEVEEGRGVLQAALDLAPRGTEQADELREWLRSTRNEFASEPSLRTVPRRSEPRLRAAFSEEEAEIRDSDILELDEDDVDEPIPSLLPKVLEAARVGTVPVARLSAKVGEARALLTARDPVKAEAILADALSEGSLEAAEMLANMLSAQPERSSLYVKVRRLAAELAPGDLGRLEALRRAANADGNKTYTAALEHLLYTFDASAPPPQPPPLDAQSPRSWMMGLLTHRSRGRFGEAFALVSEHASALLVRVALATITGLERVTPRSEATLARLHVAASRLLDVASVPIYARPGSGPPGAEVAIGHPPAGIVHGDLRQDRPELRFALGEALCSALPSHALLLGVAPQDAQALWRAMLAAFGPPDNARTIDRAAAALGEGLWQTLPPRAQRRLSELLATPEEVAFEELLAHATQSVRRVGFFLSGDFGRTAHSLLADVGRDPRAVDSPGALVHLCRELPELADIYRLAIRPDYADARWRPGAAPLAGVPSMSV